MNVATKSGRADPAHADDEGHCGKDEHARIGGEISKPRQGRSGMRTLQRVLPRSTMSALRGHSYVAVRIDRITK